MKKLIRKIILWALSGQKLKATVYTVSDKSPVNEIVFVKENTTTDNSDAYKDRLRKYRQSSK